MTVQGMDGATDPVDLFNQWLEEAVAGASLRQPRACCLSSTGLDGHPDARFVDLKEATEHGFVFGTHLESPKAQALHRDPRASLTFWWDHLGCQVRVAGMAERLPDSRADELFRTRPRAAQLVSSVFRQSAPISGPAELTERLAQAEASAGADALVRPAAWGAFCVRPSVMEFLRFAPSRLHERVRYERTSDGWRATWLQP